MTTNPDALAELAAADPDIEDIVSWLATARDLGYNSKIRYLLTRLAEAHAREREAREIIDAASHLATWNSWSSHEQLRRNCDKWLAAAKPGDRRKGTVN